MYPECLIVLNTTKAEHNTLQNNKDNQGLFAATLSFMLTQSSGNNEIKNELVHLKVTLHISCVPLENCAVGKTIAAQGSSFTVNFSC